MDLSFYLDRLARTLEQFVESFGGSGRFNPLVVGVCALCRKSEAP